MMNEKIHSLSDWDVMGGRLSFLADIGYLLSHLASTVSIVDPAKWAEYIKGVGGMIQLTANELSDIVERFEEQLNEDGGGPVVREEAAP